MFSNPLPNAELHLHVEGAIEPELLIRFARRNGMPMPSWDVEELRSRYVFSDLQSFLDLHYANLEVMKTEQDFYELAQQYLSAARDAGVRRAESFVDAQLHTARGVPLEAVLHGYGAAFAEARSDDFSCDMILGFTRDRGADEAMETLKSALAIGTDLLGVGLDSTEVGYPPAMFKDVYEAAAAEGLERVAHAGEEGGPDYVWEAIDLLGVSRVDHGLRAMEDPRLVERLAESEIALTVCPLSNVALRAVPSMAEHPVTAMLDAGIRVTVSSDDPAYFGGQVDANFAALRAAGITDAQLRQLAVNSFDAAFISEPERVRWKAEVAAAG